MNYFCTKNLLFIVFFLVGLNAWSATEISEGSVITYNGLPLWIEKVMEREETSCFFSPTSKVKEIEIRTSKNSKDLLLVKNAGLRLLQWQSAFNEFRERSGQPRISLNEAAGSEKEENLEVSGSIENPYILGESKILEMFAEVERAPQFFKDIVLSKKDFIFRTSLEDSELKNWVNKLNKSYNQLQSWEYFTSQGVEDLLSLSSNDFQAYYALKNIANLPQKLEAIQAQVDVTFDDEISNHLVRLCRNQRFEQHCCQKALNMAINEKRLKDYYRFFNSTVDFHWKQMFRIKSKNPDIRASLKEKIIDVPFLDPVDNKVRKFFKEQIEDEYRLNGWRVRLRYVSDVNEAAGTLQFKENESAKVWGFRDMVLPKERSLEDQKLTVRHEFGHILGFQDCYHAHFDVDKESVVYYELKPDNIMCSLKGKFTEGMLSELIETYTL